MIFQCRVAACFTLVVPFVRSIDATRVLQSARGLESGVNNRKVDVGGSDRIYDIYVPKSYTGMDNVPLVINIHALGFDEEFMQRVSGMNEKAEEEGFIVAYPVGFRRNRFRPKSFNAGTYCCGDAVEEGVDDISFMKAIVDDISREFQIDGQRVYATGLSNGGAMSHRIACELSHIFAAVASVSFPLDVIPFDNCKPARPISVMHLHSPNDLLVFYNGGSSDPSKDFAATDDSFAYWAHLNECSAAPEVTYTKGRSQCSTFGSCKEDVKVTLCTILPSNHVLYTNPAGFPVAEVIWAFLSNSTMPSNDYA